MSQPDLLTQLRESRPVAPAELRERIARLAAEASPPPHRPVSRRRLFAVLVPVTAAAVVVGAGPLTRGGAPRQSALVEHSPAPVAAATAGAAATDTAVQPPALRKSSAPAANGLTTVSPSRTRVQDYSASLQLRLCQPEGRLRRQRAGRPHRDLARRLPVFGQRQRRRQQRLRRPRPAHPGHARPRRDQPALRPRHDHRRERLDPGPADPGRRGQPQDHPPESAARRLAGAAADHRGTAAHRGPDVADRPPAARPCGDRPDSELRHRAPRADDSHSRRPRPPGPRAAAQARRHLPLGRNRSRLRPGARRAPRRSARPWLADRAQCPPPPRRPAACLELSCLSRP